MKCTACKIGTLKPSYLDGVLLTHKCNNCQGHLLYIQDYLKWLDKYGQEYQSSDTDMILAGDTEKAIICPVSGAIMTKYKISHRTQHRVDYSPTSGAIWLDSGEWDLLKEENIVLQLNNVFSFSWQKKIRQDRAAENEASRLRSEFGNDYEKISLFKEWLDSNPKKADITAYLLS